MGNVDYSAEIKKFFKGEVFSDEQSLSAASHDASLFEVKPSLVVAPRDVEDVKNLVKFAAASRSAGRGGTISLTARSAGTDMSGGPLTESVVVNFLPHFNHIKSVDGDSAVTEPGVYYRDFEKETLKKGLLFPSYPASRELCTLGGIVANNSGGEKTLVYGKTENYARDIKMVLADGNEYDFHPLVMPELEAAKKRPDFFGEIHRKMFDLIAGNYDTIKAAKPDVSKNSAGYYLWNVYDKEKGTFDFNKLIVGSQGTLGLITEATIGLIKPKLHSKLLVIFLNDTKLLAATAAHILQFKPESFESYDDHTFKIAVKFLPTLIKQMGGNLISLGLQFLPEMLAVLEGGVPKLVLMAEFTADTDEEATRLAEEAQTSIKEFHEKSRITKTEQDEKKYWVIRRESFNMLRQHVHGLRTAPFIDDFAVKPEFLSDFLPKLDEILAGYKITYTIAGHIGDGNFHIIPLMDLKKEESVEIIKELSEKVYRLVLDFKGTITGEHNDGLIRSSFLPMMYGPAIMKLFEETKKIFDPLNIFNPGKKVGASREYAWKHLNRN